MQRRPSSLEKEIWSFRGIRRSTTEVARKKVLTSQDIPKRSSKGLLGVCYPGRAEEEEQELFFSFVHAFKVSEDEIQPFIDIISIKNDFAIFL